MNRSQFRRHRVLRLRRCRLRPDDVVAGDFGRPKKERVHRSHVVGVRSGLLKRSRSFHVYILLERSDHIRVINVKHVRVRLVGTIRQDCRLKNFDPDGANLVASARFDTMLDKDANAHIPPMREVWARSETNKPYMPLSPSTG